MADESSEMSLDDVLSSIKQMVIDKDPPVLELTDMLSSDGKIVNVKSVDGSTSTKSLADSNSGDIKTFLQLVQSSGENEVSSQEKLLLESNPAEKLDKVAAQGKSPSENDLSKKFDKAAEQENPLLENNSAEKLDAVAIQEKPLPGNCPSGKFDHCADKRSISEIVTDITTNLVKTWLDEHLENIVRDVVKQEVKNLIGK